MLGAAIILRNRLAILTSFFKLMTIVKNDFAQWLTMIGIINESLKNKKKIISGLRGSVVTASVLSLRTMI